MCECKDKGCYDCLMCALKHMSAKAAKRRLKKPTCQPKKKKKKEPAAKCGICRRKLIPGDSGVYCMTCQYQMDHDSR